MSRLISFLDETGSEDFEDFGSKEEEEEEEGT